MALKNLKQYSGIDLSKYENGFDPTKSDALTGAGEKKQNAESAYNTFLNTGYQSQYATLANDAMNAYLNRDPFSYDFNADALYQQYKDKYIQQGKMAMQDTMGQAAAMTGGYGNSYAATVGNQAYQAHLQNLNDVIPELYQMAYDRYNQQGQDMLNQYSLLGNAIDREYGMWNDTLGRLMADRDYYGQEESNLYNREYGAWDDNRTYDQTQYWKETEYGYGKDQDAIMNAFREREMAMAEKEFALKEALNSKEVVWNPEKNQYEPVPPPATPTPKYSNRGYTLTQIMQMQKAAGIKADGIWGAETEAAYNAGWRWYGKEGLRDEVRNEKDVVAELEHIIENAKDKKKAKSEVSTYLRNAFKNKIISKDQYDSLMSTYAPRGNAY